MKTLLTLFAILCTGTVMDAAPRDKFLGKWSGTSTVETNGTQIKSRITMNVKPWGEKGLLAINTVTTNGVKTVSQSYYLDSGKLKSTVRQSGVFIASASGTWEIRRNTAITNQKVVTAYGSYTQIGENTIVSPGKVVGTGTNSLGMKARLVAYKR